MKLEHPFYKFPFRFDAEQLTREVMSIPEDAWCRHPNELKGNSFLPLVATRGESFDDFDPPMRPTAFLNQMPYIRQVLSEFRTLIGRTRLMRLEPGHGVPPHFDSQQYWRDHTRVHVPVVTNPAIRFHCGEASVHMAAGEAWTFDNWRNHAVVNETSTRRIHLTMDTYGSNEFWDLAKPFGNEGIAFRRILFRKGIEAPLLFETYTGPAVMSPAELDIELSSLVRDAQTCPGNDAAALELLRTFAKSLTNEWRVTWHLKGPTEDGIAHFISLARWACARAAALPPNIKLASNGNMLFPGLIETLRSSVRMEAVDRPPLPVPSGSGPIKTSIERPVFIVAAPRSGSTMLFEMMAANDAFMTLGDEGHGHVESIGGLHPQSRNFESNRLVASDARAPVADQLRTNYLRAMLTSQGKPLISLGAGMPKAVRFLEKTPKNALRVPFLKAVFPDAKFIFLHRDARSNISAIMEAWSSGRFVTYPALPGWDGPPWSMLLIPDWPKLSGRPIAEIAMRQWRDSNEVILNDLTALPPEDWCSVTYDEAVTYPEATLERLYDFAGVPFEGNARLVAQRPIPNSRSTISPPDPDKWRSNEEAIAPFLAETAATTKRLAELGVPTDRFLETAK